MMAGLARRLLLPIACAAALVPVIVVVLGFSAHAQGLALGGGGAGPVEVEADQGIEWRREQKVIIARGNAIATRGESSVAGDRLTAFYREADGGEEIYRFEAEGNVEIRTGPRTFHGERAVYEADRDVMVLFGDPVRAEAPEERLTARESIEFRNAENVAVARGDVRAERGDQRLRADTLTARFVEGEAGKLEVRNLEADGSVILSTPTDIVRGRHLAYDVQSEVATVTGSVRITHGENQLNGDVAEVNLATGVSRLMSAEDASGGRVRALLVPEGASRGSTEAPE